jgi:hypothetical protein
MVTVLKAEKVWQKKTGRPSKLSTEDQLLITLEYWREYRTYFHRGNSWGINESTAYRIVRKVENILIKSGLFNLHEKKNLLESNSEIEVIVVDVSAQESEYFEAFLCFFFPEVHQLIDWRKIPESLEKVFLQN